MVASLIHGRAPLYKVGTGIQTHLGLNLPPGGEVVAYVHHSGSSYPYATTDMQARVYTTLNAALALTRGSGYPDKVLILPGHAENISAADQMSNLKADTEIIGLGNGTSRPTFTWTVAAASFLLDVANVSIENCILNLCSTGNGGVTVAAPITVSAASCKIRNCYIDFGGDVDDIVTIGITTTAAANDFWFVGNTCVGATAGATGTTFMQIVGGARLRLIGNFISGASSGVAVGLVRALTTAFTDAIIADNYIANNLASSEEALTLINSCTGLLEGNRLAVLDNASVALDNDGDMTYGPDNTLANTVGERGLTLGTLSA